MTSMSSRQYHEASIATVNVFHGGPGADNAVSRPEGKVVQVWRERESMADRASGLRQVAMVTLVHGVT